MVGVTVNYWGSEAADGLLHFFEGWVIFLACGGLLAFEIYSLARLSGKNVFDVFYFPNVAAEPNQERQSKKFSQLPVAVSLLTLCAAGALTYYISSRGQIIPDRPRFVAFPEQIGPWRGRTSLLDPDIERLLHPDDYILSDYKRSDGRAVNLYVVYYASQRDSTQPHNPSDCIPGSGWQITNFERTSYNDKFAKFSLNRAIIEKNTVKQLVYYWFDERGRRLANEYWVKWYLHTDAMVMNRTDGAMVRLITRINRDETESAADARLKAFIRDAVPILSDYLPAAAKSHQVEAVPLESKKAKL